MFVNVLMIDNLKIKLTRFITQKKSLISEDKEPSFCYKKNISHSDLKQVLVREVISGIDFKDEDMIDSSFSPSISVNAQQEEELDQEETTPIDSHQRPDILFANEHSTW